MKILTLLQRQYDSYRLRRYLRGRKIFCLAPYSVQIYEGLLKKVKGLSERISILDGSDPMEITPDKVNLFVRHDLDTQSCIEKMSLLLDIDQELNIPASIYLRADGVEYSLSSYRTTILNYRGQGFRFGLHSLCYLKDHYLEEFEKETETFEVALGFHPTSFNVHGMGTIRLQTRMNFLKEITRNFRDFGYDFGDIPTLLDYWYVIQDCHLDGKNQRFIYDDFSFFPEVLAQGQNGLILTHPCYWEAGA